jgi:DNA-binding GntR family transcriptional regulator
MKRQEASVNEHYQLIELAVGRDVEKIGALISHHVLSWKPLFHAVLNKSI